MFRISPTYRFSPAKNLIPVAAFRDIGRWLSSPSVPPRVPDSSATLELAEVSRPAPARAVPVLLPTPKPALPGFVAPLQTCFPNLWPCLYYGPIRAFHEALSRLVPQQYAHLRTSVGRFFRPAIVGACDESHAEGRIVRHFPGRIVPLDGLDID